VNHHVKPGETSISNIAANHYAMLERSRGQSRSAKPERQKATKDGNEFAAIRCNGPQKFVATCRLMTPAIAAICLSTWQQSRKEPANFPVGFPVFHPATKPRHCQSLSASAVP
jgi:hypothetical protein